MGMQSFSPSLLYCLSTIPPPPLATPLDTGRTDIPYRYTVNLTTKRHSLLISGRGKALIQSHSDLGTLQVNNQMIMIM